MNDQGAINKVIRGTILKLLYEGHEAQRSRMNLTLLHGSLDRLGFRLGRNAVITLLQNLRDRSYVKFAENRNRDTYRLDIFQIEITAQGTDVVEGTTNDPAVEV